MDNLKNNELKKIVPDNGIKSEVANKPSNVPEKFWNSETGSLRDEELLKSYLELEKKFSSCSKKKGDDKNILELALETEGPASDYNIVLHHKLLDIDENLNKRLKNAGFTNAQAQLVYDLGAEIVMPLIENIVEQFRAYRELEKLEKYFGGEERFDEISRQILMWAEKNVPEEIYESLNSSYYGVIALYNMMTSNNEPSMVNMNGEGESVLSEKKLRSMMSDPRYWRDGDKDFIKKVDEGFKNLYDR
ncbi:hypothetical protein HDR60_05305 [bacterium]|nr:hypothetical protein [bacterium]